MRLFKFQKNDTVVLKNIFVHPATLDFINVGKIVKVQNRFSFKPTKYLIYLADGYIPDDDVRYSSCRKWFNESEIKEIVKGN